MKILPSLARFNVTWFFFTAAAVQVSGVQLGETSYSLTIPKAISPIANHLDHGDNTVAALLPSVPEGTLLYKFDTSRLNYTVNQFQFGAWLKPQDTLAPGEGAFIRNPGNEFSITFTGTKPSNAQAPTLSARINLISLPAPGETRLAPAKNADAIFGFNTSRQSFTAHTFDGLHNDWGPPLDPGLLTKLGESFFYTVPSIPSPGVASGPSVYFSNYLPGVVDARVQWPGRTGAGTGFTAQLFAGPAGTPTDKLVPLTPASTFQTTSVANMGYVNPVVVTVPGAVNSSATFVMRVFNGATYDTSSARAESAPITVALGSGLTPPANLVGLQGVSLPAPTGGISVERIAKGLKLTYTGTLQSADAVAGPYADVTAATSPASITFSGTAKFYRLKP